MYYNNGYKVINYTNFINYNKWYNISIIVEDQILPFSVLIETTYSAEMIYSTNLPTTYIQNQNINHSKYKYFSFYKIIQVISLFMRIILMI